MSVESRVVLKRDLYFPKHKIPKFLTVYYLIYQAVGMEFGFALILKRKYRLIIQRTTQFVSLLIFVTMLVYLAFLYNDIWCWIYMLKYNGFILVLIRTRYKPYHLIYDINGICDLTTKQINILKIVTISCAILMNIIKTTFWTFQCIWEKEPYCKKFYSPLIFIFYLGIALSMDIIMATQVIITYYLKCSVNLIQVLLKKPKRKLDVFKKSYMAIADCYDKIRPLYDWMIILKVGVTVPEIMAYIWTCMLFIKGNGEWFSYTAEFVAAFHLTMQICAPAITVELLNSEMDTITQLLNQEIEEEKDERKIEELNHTLRYITKRPLRHLVWRFIPIDIRLFLTLFNLCTSYFIVVLQFSQII